MLAYLWLLAAILLEVAGTFCLKLSQGFENPIPTGLAFFFYAVMNVPLILALRTLDLSLVYATWAGVGIIAATSLSALYFSEPMSGQRLFFIAVTVFGVVGLNLNQA